MRPFKPLILQLLTLLTLSLALSACNDAKLPPIPAQGSILAFGDSLTKGKGVEQDHSYPSVLAKLSGRRVINEGISGEVTSDGLKRFATVLHRNNPDLVILLEGGNDILRNFNLEDTKNNLAAMIELTQDSGVPVVLIGVPAKSLFADTAPLYHELAEQYQLVLADELIGDLMRQPNTKSDLVHFNVNGYRQMAERIHQLLIDHGAL